jgi:hypothetical protein
MSAPRCPVCGGRMLKSPDKQSGAVLVWWCNGISKDLELHTVTITQIKGVRL